MPLDTRQHADLAGVFRVGLRAGEVLSSGGQMPGSGSSPG
jgi:hypothetical protein